MKIEFRKVVDPLTSKEQWMSVVSGDSDVSKRKIKLAFEIEFEDEVDDELTYKVAEFAVEFRRKLMTL